jgi:hypothetical protein
VRLPRLAAVAVIAFASCGSSSQCQPVADADLEASIGQGLIVDGAILRDGFAVRSDEFEQVWFVAAEIDEPGAEGVGDVGVWSTNTEPSRLESGSGLIFGINDVARRFTDWGADVEPGQGIVPSMADHGASEAEVIADRPGSVLGLILLQAATARAPGCLHTPSRDTQGW